MKLGIKVFGIACLSATLFSCGNKDVALNNLQDSVSFCLGFQTAAMWHQQGVDTITNDAFFAGFKSFNKDEENYPLDLDQEQYSELMQRYVALIEEKEKNKLAEQYGPNREEGEKFLNENKERTGVVTTASGLQYEILSEGKGPKPSLYDTIEVLYKGTLLDGTVFDSTTGNETVKFPLIPYSLIEGWIEAFPLLSEGTKAKLFIPYNLAYGEYGNAAIQPYSTLIFEVELKKVIKGKKPENGPQRIEDVLPAK